MVSEQRSLQVGFDTHVELKKFQDLRQCENEEQIKIKIMIERVSNRLGFDYYFYRARFVLDHTRRIDRILSNYPAAWLQQYKHDDLARIDPAVQHAHSTLTPLVWDPYGHIDAEQARFVGEAQRHGLATGVSFPVHNKDGDIGVFSLALGTQDVYAHGLIQENLYFGAFIANCIHDRMRSLVW